MLFLYSSSALGATSFKRMQKELSTYQQELRQKLQAKINEVDAVIEKLIYVDMPEYAMHFDSLLKTNAYLQEEYVQRLRDEYDQLLEQLRDKSVAAKKLASKTSNAPTQNQGAETAKSDEEQSIFDQVFEKLKIVDISVRQLEEIVRTEVSQLSQLIEQIKKWFYVVPSASAVASGVQESTDQVLNVIKVAVNQLIDQQVHFHMNRGKLLAKFQKLKLYDLAKTLVQFDIQQIQSIRNSFVDIFTALIVAYDTTSKTFEDLRNSNQDRRNKF